MALPNFPSKLDEQTLLSIESEALRDQVRHLDEDHPDINPALAKSLRAVTDIKKTDAVITFYLD